MYFQAQQELRKLEDWPQAFAIFNEELLNLHRGQGMELYWRDTLQPPSEPDYLQMVANKTGGLFRLILRLLQSASKKYDKSEYDLGPLVDVLGLMFQILDDYKNLKDDQVGFDYCYQVQWRRMMLTI
jgi:geranylgeranyl diphosphate synthase type 3